MHIRQPVGLPSAVRVVNPASAVVDGHRATDGFDESGEQFQQRAFARASGADDGDLVAFTGGNHLANLAHIGGERHDLADDADDAGEGFDEGALHVSLRDGRTLDQRPVAQGINDGYDEHRRAHRQGQHRQWR